MNTKPQSIEFTRLSNDINGNPRYVCHFLNLINSNEVFTDISEKYTVAVKIANKLGGKKYHTKGYGGGIVFQSYNIQDTENRIHALVAKY